MMRIYRISPDCAKCVVKLEPLPKKIKKKLKDVSYLPLEDLLSIPALLVENAAYQNLLKDHIFAKKQKKKKTNISFTFEIKNIRVSGAEPLQVGDLDQIEIYRFISDGYFLSDPETAMDAALRVYYGLLKNNTLYANIYAGVLPAFPTEPLEKELNEKIGVDIESLEKDGKSILLEGNLTAYERSPDEFSEDGVSFFGHTRYI